MCMKFHNDMGDKSEKELEEAMKNMNEKELNDVAMKG